MQIKHVLSAVVLGVALPMGAAADPEDKSEALAEALGLDEEKTSQVQQVLETYHDQAKAIKSQAHEQIKQLKDQKEQQLQTILSEQEFDRYEAIMELTKDKKKGKKWKDDDRD